MKQYTIHDAAEVLGTDIETLDHWLHDAQLTLVHDTQDRSAPVLSQEQIELLAQRHNIQLVPPTDEPLRRLPPQQSESEGICVDALHLKKVARHHTSLLHDISLHIPQNAFIALVGGSGVGKTTLMYALSGLRPAPQ